MSNPFNSPLKKYEVVFKNTSTGETSKLQFKMMSSISIQDAITHLFPVNDGSLEIISHVEIATVVNIEILPYCTN